MSEHLSGHTIDLPDDRHVFVARHDGRYYIQLRNSDGHRTRIVVSHEAAEALAQLLPEPASPFAERPHEIVLVKSPIVMEWAAVEPAAVLSSGQRPED